MNPLRKFVSSFVTVTTVLWSMGGALLLPSVAQAATLTPGDLIKASGPAVYYYSADGNRYVFPNEKTYFSWYADFSSVVTITDAELAAILIGGNVTIRPGTKLVKITTDPKTYAVSSRCGMLHWIESETIAEALYGTDWNTRIVDVPDAFFVDYEVGSSVSTEVHPDGQLITIDGDSETYVVMGGAKRKLVGSAAADNMLDVANAIETAIVYADGVDVTGYEEELGKVACESGMVVLQGSVDVTLASDTPAGKTLPKNGASIDLAKFNFTSDSNESSILGISFKRVGVGATTDFSNVYLYDGEGNRLSTGRTINSSTNIVTFNGLDLAIAANSTVSLMLVGDLSSPTTAGGQHAFEISDAASVVISGVGTVGGVFPSRANVFTVGTISAGTVTVTNGTDPSDVAIGSSDVEIANFKLAAATNDIEIRRVTLTINDGGATLADFTLYQGATAVASVATKTSEDLVVLNFDTPYVIGEGTTKTFSLRASVSGRSGYTIATYVENSTDVMAVDMLYNSGAAVTVTAYDYSSSSASEASVVVTIGGQLTRAQNGPATGNISKGGTDVVLYNFALTASDSDLDVRRLRFLVNESASSTGESLLLLTDVKVKNVATGVTIAGPAGTITDNTEFVLMDNFSIPAGTTLNLQVTGDVSNAAESTGDVYTVTLNPVTLGDIKIASSNQDLALADIIPNTAVAGNAMTVIASSLTTALAANPAATTVVKKQSNVPTAGFVLTAGNDQAVNISQIVLQGAATTTGETTLFTSDYFNDLVSVCGLYDGDTLLKSDGPDSTGVMTFTSLNITLAAGGTKTLVAKCGTLSTITGTPAFAVGLSSVTAQGVEDSNEITVTPTDALNNLDSVSATVGATPTIAQTLANNGTGSLTIATGSQPEAANILGETAVKFAEFRATAIDEAVQITKIHVTSTGDAATLTEVSIRVAGTVYGTGVLASGIDSNVTSTLTTPIVVDKDATKTIEIWGETGVVVKSDAASGAKSGNTILLAAKPNSFEAFGLASGEKLTVTSSDVSGNSMILRKSQPVVAVMPITGALPASGEADLIKFQVNANAAGDVAWKQVVFTVATTSAVTSLTGFKLYRGTSNITTNSVGTSTFDGSILTIVLAGGQEEVVTNAGTSYTIRATLTTTSVASGDSITTKIREETAATTAVTAAYDAVNGYLTGGSAANSSFVWSDLSSPGSPLIANPDWTNGVYVKDLTNQKVLSY